MRRKCKPFAAGMVAAGALIILAMLMPGYIWWFLIGIALIAAGLVLMRR